MDIESKFKLYSIKANKSTRKYGILFNTIQDINNYCESMTDLKKYIETSCIFHKLLLVIFLSQGKKKSELSKVFNKYKNIEIYTFDQKKANIIKFSSEVPIFIDEKPIGIEKKSPETVKFLTKKNLNELPIVNKSLFIEDIKNKFIENKSIEIVENPIEKENADFIGILDSPSPFKLNIISDNSTETKKSQNSDDELFKIIIEDIRQLLNYTDIYIKYRDKNDLKMLWFIAENRRKIESLHRAEMNSRSLSSQKKRKLIT